MGGREGRERIEVRDKTEVVGKKKFILLLLSWRKMVMSSRDLRDFLRFVAASVSRLKGRQSIMLDLWLQGLWLQGRRQTDRQTDLLCVFVKRRNTIQTKRRKLVNIFRRLKKKTRRRRRKRRRRRNK